MIASLGKKSGFPTMKKLTDIAETKGKKRSSDRYVTRHNAMKKFLYFSTLVKM